MTTRLSLAELAAAEIPLRPAEAVAIVAELCRQYSSGRIPGIPSPGVIRLSRDGAVVAEGPITTGAESGVRRAAHLLSDLLPEFDAPAGYRASGGLRLVVARALGTLDLPPYDTLEAFCDALTRFSAADLDSTIRNLFRAWDEALTAPRPADPVPALTISDIRRARRATGLSLDDLSAVAGVPAARLRELEWGYFRNWKADYEGRAHVIRYARAAGLDEAVVLSIAWPMIEDGRAMAEERPAPVVALVPSGPQGLVAAAPSAGPRSRSSLASWAVVAVAAALLALATYGVATGAAQDQKPTRVAAGVNEPVMTQEARPGESSMTLPPPLVPPLAPQVVPEDAPQAAPQRAPQVAPPARRPAAGRQAVRPAHPPQRRSSPRNRSFLRKELFRIVIR
jgi:hypothetical protein